MNSSPNKIGLLDTDFSEAARNWHLDRLYIDLAAAKGRALTPLEKKFLKGLLCGYSPAEISVKVYKTPNSSAVRVYLSSGLYKYIRELFLRQRSEEIKLGNWSRVANLLQQAGYKKQTPDPLPVRRTGVSSPLTQPTDKIQRSQNWKRHIDRKEFCGREEEIAQLQKWILRDRARLVSLLGLGGMGKTMLAAQLVERIQGEFERVIWRSLSEIASLQELLDDALETLASKEELTRAKTPASKIALVIEKLRSQRCLLVFDSAERFLEKSDGDTDLTERARFGQLLKRIGEESHASCCLLVSREKPKELRSLEENSRPNHSLCLEGLQLADALKLPEIQALADLESQKQFLVKLYASNPLLLKIAALTINKFFNSNITEFLQAGTFTFGEIRELLDRQFDRLSTLEQQVLYNLALSQCLGELRGFVRDIPLGISPRERLEALESLQRRMLIHKSATGFRPKTLLHTYLLEKIIEQICTQVSDRQMARSIEQILRESLFGNYLSAAIAVA